MFCTREKPSTVERGGIWSRIRVGSNHRGAKALKEKASTLDGEIKSLKEKLTVYRDKRMGNE